MTEARHEHHVEQLSQHQHHDRHLDRRADVLARIEAGGKDLHAHQAHQADAVAHQRAHRLRHVGGGEGAVVVQHRDQRCGKHQQGHRARQCQQQHQAQAPVDQFRVGVGIVHRLRSRQLRQQHHPQRHAEQRGRELHQTVCIREPRHRPHADPRGELGVDQLRQVGHRHAQHGRCHLAEHPADAGVVPGAPNRRRCQADARQAADANQRRHLHRELQHATDQHTDRQRVDGFDALALEHRCQPDGSPDHRQVQQHRRRRRNGEALPGVQDAGRQRDQRHEADVGQHPARHDHGSVEALQAGGHQPDDQRRGHDADRAGDEQRPEQHRGDGIDQVARGLFALAGPGL